MANAIPLTGLACVPKGTLWVLAVGPVEAHDSWGEVGYEDLVLGERSRDGATTATATATATGKTGRVDKEAVGAVAFTPKPARILMHKIASKVLTGALKLAGHPWVEELTLLSKDTSWKVPIRGGIVF